MMQKTQWTKLLVLGMCAAFTLQAKADRFIEREIPQMKTAPSIDGDLTEWADVASFKLVAPSWMHKYDLSAKVWLAWDADNFYMAVKVYDEKFVNDNNPESGLYAGDQVRLRISAQPEAQDVNFGAADREVFISPTSANGQPACTFKVGAEGLEVVAAEGGAFPWAVGTHDRGYTVECAIPVSLLGVDQFAKGSENITYSLAIYDRDTPDANEWKTTHTRISSSNVKKQPREWPALRLSENVLILKEDN
ncbi:sugar-binding protein [Kiritimatiellota bacterium B12222]|nr:sugar-binding protein [Kiritimatiellota bacterium B12222]